MILFINLCDKILSKSKETTKFVFWGVQIIPTPAENKSLQVSGLYYGRLLGFIKHHIDATIAEMESLTPTPAPTPEPQTYTQDEINEAYDSLFGFTQSTPTPQVEDTIAITETEPEPEVVPQPEVTPETLKAWMLACTTKQQLEELKAEIGAETSKEIWELCSVPERNYIKCISKATDPKKSPAVLGYRFQYTVPITQIKFEAIYLGYYLHGEPVGFADDKRVILVENEAIICDKTDLKPLANKNQLALTPEERDRLEEIISNPQSELEAPTAEEIAALNFTGLESSPKHQVGNSGNQLDSQALNEIETGDLVRVNDPNSIANGKTVEVHHVRPNGDIKSSWDGKTIYVQAGGYTLEIKNILNSPKA